MAEIVSVLNTFALLCCKHIYNGTIALACQMSFNLSQSPSDILAAC